jgi:hypothetical protein
MSGCDLTTGDTNRIMIAAASRISRDPERMSAPVSREFQLGCYSVVANGATPKASRSDNPMRAGRHHPGSIPRPPGRDQAGNGPAAPGRRCRLRVTGGRTQREQMRSDKVDRPPGN